MLNPITSHYLKYHGNVFLIARSQAVVFRLEQNDPNQELVVGDSWCNMSTTDVPSPRQAPDLACPKQLQQYNIINNKNHSFASK